MGNRREFLINTTLVSIGSSLLSSRLSKSKSIDLQNCEKTTADYFGEGPFYTDQPPIIKNNLLAPATAKGKRLIIMGRVLNLKCSEFLPETIVDVWHANHKGQYDNTGYKLRGFTKTNAQGFYLFETIMPGKYLNGPEYRPAHIHFKIKPPGFEALTTQLYFEGDDRIADDKSASIKSGNFDASNRIISLNKNNEGQLEGQFDIVINGDGPTIGAQDLHLNTGMIYKTEKSENGIDIDYGVFKTAKVGLVVYDMQGQQVAILEEKMMTPEKYKASWKPKEDLSTGYYFVAIKINDLQVHYQKVIL